MDEVEVDCAKYTIEVNQPDHVIPSHLVMNSKLGSMAVVIIN